MRKIYLPVFLKESKYMLIKKQSPEALVLLFRRILVSVGILVLMTGCGATEPNRKVVFTTGFNDDEVFRIEDVTCSLSEVMVYLVNTQEGYESSFGKEIWSAQTDSGTVEDRLKESVLAKVAQIKAMNLLALENDIALTEDEIALADTAASEYYETLSDADIAAMNNVSCEEISAIYQEKAVADKLYSYLIRDINPEISDDEARTITVEQILLKTYKLTASGQKQEMSDIEKRAVYQTARSILMSLKNDVSFEELMGQFNEADEGTLSFGKGEMEEAYETIAFNLGNDEVSSIVETSEGYVIIKCLSTFNREETEANKIKIVAERKREVFGSQYDTFVSTLTKELNQKLWDSITLVSDDNVTASNFSDVYNKYFAD